MAHKAGYFLSGNRKLSISHHKVRTSAWQGPMVPVAQWDQATEITAQSTTVGAENASETHDPGSLFDLFSDHRIVRELSGMSR